MKRLIASLVIAASTIGGVVTMQTPAHACTPGDARSIGGQVYVCIATRSGGVWIRP